MSKCPTCPIAGPCVGERPGRAFACKLAIGSDAERRWVREQSEGVAPVEPTLLRKAASLGKAAGRFVASGLAVVSREEFDRRHAICEACPRFDAKRDRCRICGCNLAVKPWGRDMECPEDRW